MQSLLAEQPLIVSLMLGVLATGLIFGWLQTGKKQAAIAGVVVALLIPVAWIVAAKWETDREQIRRLVYEIADAVEKNDAERAVTVIDDPATKAQARIELARFKFSMANVNKIRSIDVIEGTIPKEADVDMSVKVDVTLKAGTTTNYRVLRRLLLRLQKVGDSWVVKEYRHMPIVGKADQYTTVPLNR
mgnify:CR=1 FL=1